MILAAVNTELITCTKVSLKHIDAPGNLEIL